MNVIERWKDISSASVFRAYQQETNTAPTLITLSSLRIAIIPLLLKHPIWAVLISITIDEFDGYIFNILTPWTRIQYQNWDKVIDLIWYIALIFYSKFHFSKARYRWLVFFFLFRTVGQVLFFFIPHEEVFLFFPNYFENLFIVWLLDKHWPWFGRMMKKKYCKYVIYSITFAIAIVREIVVHLGSANVQVW